MDLHTVRPGRSGRPPVNALIAFSADEDRADLDELLDGLALIRQGADKIASINERKRNRRRYWLRDPRTTILDDAA